MIKHFICFDLSLPVSIVMRIFSCLYIFSPSFCFPFFSPFHSLEQSVNRTMNVSSWLSNFFLSLQWFPCPFMTKYCCRREEVFDRSDAQETEHHNRNSTESGVNRTNPSLNAPTTRIYRENSHSNLIKVVPQSFDTRPSTVPKVSNASIVPGASNVSSASNASEVSSASVASNTLPKKPWRDTESQACACTTRDQCLAWWSELDDPPEVKVRTILQCEVPGQVTCCFGRIVPPHHYKSRDPTSSGDAARHSFKTSRWLPFATTFSRNSGIVGVFKVVVGGNCNGLQ